MVNVQGLNAWEPNVCGGVKLALTILEGKYLRGNCPFTTPKNPLKEISRKIRTHNFSVSLKIERLVSITYPWILSPQQACFEEFSRVNASRNQLESLSKTHLRNVNDEWVSLLILYKEGCSNYLS